MLTFASPSAAPSVAAWLESASASLATLFSKTSVRPASSSTVMPHAVATHAPAPTTQRQRAVSPVGLPHAQEDYTPCDDTPHAGGGAMGATYWPCERLNAFILQMAAHGHCVSAAMMLGHRPYAVQQLAAALQVPDNSLRSLAAELQTYFDAPACVRG